jgi:threonine/homoserine/homoserine lactone efflux protein
MEFLLLASAHFIALLSPGPDFFLILQASLRLPLRYAISVCAGIAAANAVYLCCAVLGLEVVRQMDGLMTVLRYLGAIYLVFIGIMLLRSQMHSFAEDDGKRFLHGRSFARQFSIGFMSGIFNPKNAIFYLSLFTVMVSDHTPLPIRGLYGLWMTLVVFLWDTLVVLVLSRNRIKAGLGRGVFLLEKAAGVMLACFGLFLPFT